MIDSYDWFVANPRGREGGSHHQKPVRQGLMGVLKRL